MSYPPGRLVAGWIAAHPSLARVAEAKIRPHEIWLRQIVRSLANRSSLVPDLSCARIADTARSEANAMSQDNDRPRMPESHAGRALHWLLGQIRVAGAGVVPSDRDRFVPSASRSQGEGELRKLFKSLAARIGSFEVESIEPQSESTLSAVLHSPNDKRWRFVCQLEDTKPHRISKWDWERVLDFEVVVREAVTEDGPALAEIERSCPLVLGGHSVIIDRGDDYFAFARLMEDVTVSFGLIDGEPAGINCGAVRTARIDGIDQRIMVAIHTRILPEHQRKGLWSALSRLLGEKYSRERGIAGSCGYGSVDNAAIQRGFAHVPEKWDPGPVRVQMDCAAGPAPDIGRIATRDDAPRIVEILNACHGNEEMYTPYTVESFTARLERAPAQYSFKHVRLGDNAVVGVWSAGESIRVVTERDGDRSESRRGIVLDYGFVPVQSGAGESELMALLSGWRRRLATSGMDTLSILTSAASPGYRTICQLARDTEAFYAWTPGIAVPERLAEAGLYVDAIYF